MENKQKKKKCTDRFLNEYKIIRRYSILNV